MSWPKGEPLSPEHRRKVGEGLRGKKRAPYTAEHRAKIADAMTGRTLTPEHRAAISAGVRRVIPPASTVYDNRYMAIHGWLRDQHPKTGTCERCGAKPILRDGRVGTEYALRPGLSHDFNRAHYDELCRTCHRRQDLRPRRTPESAV